MTQTHPGTDPSLYPDDRPSTGMGLAVASFVCALVGLSVPAVVLGHVSRGQSRRAGMRPFAWSRWGLFFGYIELVIGLVIAAVLIGVAPGLLEGAGPVGETLRNASNAEHAHARRTGSFTPSAAELGRDGYRGQDGVMLQIVRADRSSFCLKATKGSQTLYASSYHEDVTKTPCL